MDRSLLRGSSENPVTTLPSMGRQMGRRMRPQMGRRTDQGTRRRMSRGFVSTVERPSAREPRIWLRLLVGFLGLGFLSLGASWPAVAATVAPPTNLAAIAVSETAIALAWVDNANNETSFAIQRSL